MFTAPGSKIRTCRQHALPFPCAPCLRNDRRGFSDLRACLHSERVRTGPNRAESLRLDDRVSILDDCSVASGRCPPSSNKRGCDEDHCHALGISSADAPRHVILCFETAQRAYCTGHSLPSSAVPVIAATPAEQRDYHDDQDDPAKNAHGISFSLWLNGNFPNDFARLSRRAVKSYCAAPHPREYVFFGHLSGLLGAERGRSGTSRGRAWRARFPRLPRVPPPR